MNIKNVLYGIILFVVFWAFQAGYVAFLGPAAWFVGVIIFIIVICSFCVGMPKQDAEVKQVCYFTGAFALIVTFMFSFLGPSLGMVIPAGFDPSMLTPMILSIWLVIFGSGFLYTGFKLKEGIPTIIGLIWLFSAIHFVSALSTGPNSYLHFGTITGISILVYGLIQKRSNNF